jgi:hypothetical protein
MQPGVYKHFIPTGLIAIPRFGAVILFLSSFAFAQQLTREQWGAPDVRVSQANGKWTIAGKKNVVTLNENDLAMKVQAGETEWQMASSSANDLLVQSKGVETNLRLADATKKTITHYDTGFKSGVKIVLYGWKGIDLTLVLTVTLEGRDEELAFDIVAQEHDALVRQLDWPAALDARDVDYTLLSNGRGTLLPRNWPKEYYPIRSITPEGKIAATDHSLLQSNVIESWSMSWWGFQKGTSAMMIIIETPDDAAYHSIIGRGPTIGPLVGPTGTFWLSPLGPNDIPRRQITLTWRSVTGVTLWRWGVLSLNEKIARTPSVKELIGTPQTRISILRNMGPDSDRYDLKDAAKNYNLSTFDERAKQLRDLKARGFDHVLVLVSGWPHLGYDRQHPDSLPPPEKAGGWEGFKRLGDTARELGYLYILHDQYRDYYLDAPSYNPQFAVREKDSKLPAQAFPGSRFGDAKEGDIPMMRHWDGGKQAYLNNRYWLGHLVKNYQLFFDHGITPQGIYLDVIGYVPPDEDFNPEHPTTRTEAMAGRASTMTWSRHNLGIVATESGADWTIPYVDTINQSGGGSKAILVPLYNLVYHDAVIVSFGARDQPSLLRGILNGGVPELPITTTDEKTQELMRTMMALHKRVALLEMTKHEFLDKNYRIEQTTYADGTTVTVDWDTNKFTVKPALNLAK